MRFGAEELFKEDKNDEESKKRLLSMDIDEILERAEKVEEKAAEAEEGNELLSAFKASKDLPSGRHFCCSFFLILLFGFLLLMCHIFSFAFPFSLFLVLSSC